MALINLAWVMNDPGVVVNHSTEDEANVYYSADRTQISKVPFPDEHLTFRLNNIERGYSSQILEYNYDTKTFSVVNWEPNWTGFLNQSISMKWKPLRAQMLQATDWVENSSTIDPTVKAEVVTFRQGLRDFTKHSALQSAATFKQWHVDIMPHNGGITRDIQWQDVFPTITPAVAKILGPALPKDFVQSN